MTDRPAEYVSLTADGVVFEAWPTVVADDDLTLVRVNYIRSSYVDYPNAGLRLELPDMPSTQDFDLEALFLSREKKAIVRFEFRNVEAFRVLDEAGLLEIWHASMTTPRPAQTTFRVRGHGWQAESELEWLMAAAPDHFSYMVATGFKCLEVICSTEPAIKLTPAKVCAL